MGYASCETHWVTREWRVNWRGRRRRVPKRARERSDQRKNGPQTKMRAHIAITPDTVRPAHAAAIVEGRRDERYRGAKDHRQNSFQPSRCTVGWMSRIRSQLRSRQNFFSLHPF